MIALKGLYFLNAAMIVSQNYIALYYNQILHLQPHTLGWILSLNPFVSLVSIPSIFYIVDIWKLDYRVVLGLISLIGGGFWSLHLLISSAVGSAGIAAMAIPLVWKLVLITILCALTLSSTGSLLDALALKLLDEKDYGKHRLYASLSWGLGSFLCGSIISETGDMNWMFYLFLIFIGPFLVLLGFVRVDGIVERDDEVPVSSESNEEMPLIPPETQTTTLTKALLAPSVITFFTSITILGLIFKFIDIYLYIYLTNTWKFTPQLLGLTTPFSVFMELPIFQYSAFVEKKMGLKNMMLVAHALLVIRLFLYVFLPIFPNTPFIVLLMVELLHGAAFGLSWSAGMRYVSEIAPKEYNATFVGIFCSLYNNAGGVFGAIAGGWLYESLGYEILWSTGLVFVVFSGIIFSLNSPKLGQR